MKTPTSTHPFVRFSSRGRRSFHTLRHHGASLHAIASMLTDDPDLAAHLVVQAVASAADDEPAPGLHELSATVVVQWLGLAVRSDEPRPADRLPSNTAMLRDVHGLPDDQRALLALCRFGAHTYREAALVIGVPAGAAAVLLREALRTLAAPHVMV